MVNPGARIPPGPTDRCETADDLLGWMQTNLERYGDIYRSTVFGNEVYVVNSPAYAEHVLLGNWENYLRKGHAVKRLARTRDVSLMVLEVTLRAVFGNDYDRIAPEFQIVAEDSRDLAFANICNSLRNLIVEIISQRRRDDRTSKDILATIMQSRDRETGQPMPDRQLAKEAMTPQETTASALNWGWYLLARHPQVEARLSSELQALPAAQCVGVDALPDYVYTGRVVEEVLRSYPPSGS